MPKCGNPGVFQEAATRTSSHICPTETWSWNGRQEKQDKDHATEAAKKQQEEEQAAEPVKKQHKEEKAVATTKDMQ